MDKIIKLSIPAASEYKKALQYAVLQGHVCFLVVPPGIEPGFKV